MRMAIITIGIVILLMSGSANALNEKYFDSSGEIIQGENWDNVYVRNNNTTVNMSGGIVGELFTYDSSIFNISGGGINNLHSYGFSSINLLGSANISSWLIVSGSSELNMNGGTVDIMEIRTLGDIYLHSGVISNFLWAHSTVNIFGHDFVYEPDAWDYGGRLTGFWADNSHLSLNLAVQIPGAAADDSWSHIVLHVIPEPCTLVLISLGTIILSRRR